MNNISSNRIKWIDALRGYAIILVVLGHVIQYVYAPDNFDNNIIFRVIYSFHMPLFMFISGYLTFSKKEKNYKWLSKRFYTLVVPFITWSLIRYFVYKYNISFLQYIINVIKSPDWSYWFLWVLFLCNFVYFIIDIFLNKINYQKNNDIIILLIYLFGIALIIILNRFINILGLGLLSWHIFFFLFGSYSSYYLSNGLYKEVTKIFINNKLIKIIVLFLSVALCCTWSKTNLFIYKDCLSNLNIMIQSVLLLIYKYLTPVLGILASVVIVSKVHDKVQDALAFIGKYTLEIYVIHFFLLRNYMHNLYLNCVICFVLALLIPIIISKLLESTKYTKMVLFGKFTKRTN